MKVRIHVLFLAIMFILSRPSFALTDEEFKAIQKAADEFLSNEPSNGYHLLAEDVLKRIHSGKNDFVIGYDRSENAWLQGF